MPYYYYKEIWTPLRLVNIRFFVEMHEKNYWIKFGENPRLCLFRKK